MEFPRQNSGEYENVKDRVQLSRTLRQWRETRRANRLGEASYREVRQARKQYMAHRRHIEDMLAQGAW